MKKSILSITTALALSLIGCGNTVLPETGTENSVVATPITEAPTPEPTVIPTPVSAATPEVENTQAPSVVGNGMTENAPEIQSEDFLIEDMEPTTMYLKNEYVAKEGPNAEEFADSSYLFKGEAVSIVGVVKSYKGEECLWYRANTGEFIPSECLITEQSTVTALPVVSTAEPVVEESPLADMSDKDIQAALDAATTGNESNGGGDFSFEVHQDGGDAPDGVSGW